MANKFGEMSLDNDGYVVYKRRSTMAYREADRYRQETRIMGYFKDLDFTDENEMAMIDTVSEALMTMAQNERAKELALLESITGNKVSVEDEVDFVRNFNNLTTGARQYSEAVQKLQTLLAKNKDGGKKANGPTPGSMFFSKFQKNFGDSVRRYIYGYITRRRDRGIGEAELDQMTNWIYDKIFPSCLEKTMEELLIGGDAAGEDGEYKSIYEEIYTIFKSNELLKQMFINTMKTAFNMDSIKRIITGHKATLQKGKFSRKKGVGIKGGAWARKALEVKTKTNKTVSVGDKFDDFINALMNASLPQEITLGKNGTLVHESRGFSNKLNKMNGAEIFSMEIGVRGEELQNILNEFEDISNNGPEGKQDTLNKLKELNEKLQKLTNTFVIYRSNVLQKINNIGKRGSFNAGSYSLPEFETIMLNNVTSGLNNFGRMNVHKFMRVICNTLEGAKLDDYKYVVDYWLQSFVFESIASMLFNDWEQIGGELKGEIGANSIHIMSLNGTDIPISVFLFSAAEAFYELIEEGTLFKMVRANVTERPELLYPTPYSYEIGKDVNGKAAPLVNEAWEKQRIDAFERIRIEVRFYINFRDFILKRLKMI